MRSISICLLLLFLRPATGSAQAAVQPANSASADFAQVQHYREQNTGVHPRVVFLGDSITEYWGSRNGTWFSHAGWLNRGIGGQTTQQLMLRERADALALRPKLIVLEGGGNDMRLGFTPAQIRDNLLSLGELAQANGIAVAVAQMTPVCDCVRPLTGLRTVDRIHELNALLAAMCRDKHWLLLDLNSPLADSSGRMRPDLTVDGVHPNDAGYALLAPVIDSALKSYR